VGRAGEKGWGWEVVPDVVVVVVIFPACDALGTMSIISSSQT